MIAAFEKPVAKDSPTQETHLPCIPQIHFKLFAIYTDIFLNIICFSQMHS